MIDYTIIMVNVLKIKNKSKSVNHKKEGKKEGLLPSFLYPIFIIKCTYTFVFCSIYSTYIINIY